MIRVSRFTFALNVAGIAMLTSSFTEGQARAAPQWKDYFTPTPIMSPLSSTCWGAKEVGPRDQSNGLEDRTLATWVYWDGGIIKDEQTGIYHMFASRWHQTNGHTGWQSDSHCAHATSNNLYGPYTDQGQCWTDNNGLCHNVNAIKLKAGDTSGKKYAITCSGGPSGTGQVHGADSLDGPWTYVGNLQLNQNGGHGYFNAGANFRTILRPDGQYMCMASQIGLSDNVLGTYVDKMTDDFVNVVKGSPTTNMEDQFLFYAGGAYHVIYHCWSTGIAYFYSSQDGTTNWHLDPGPTSTTAEAYDPTTNMVRYADGTVNHWPLLERANVYVENGHAVAMTFAAINVQKENDKANDTNGSKIIVVPFNGLQYDCDNGDSAACAQIVDGGMGGSGGSGGAGGQGGSAGGAASGGTSGGSGDANGGAGAASTGGAGEPGGGGMGALGGAGMTGAGGAKASGGTSPDASNANESSGCSCATLGTAPARAGAGWLLLFGFPFLSAIRSWRTRARRN